MGNTDQTTIINTRKGWRLATLEQVRDEASSLFQPIEGGALDGIEVISRGHLADAIERVKTSPLPAIDETSAEVKTPADVYIDAICPECNLPTKILVQVSTVLETTREAGSVIKVKAKAKAKTHVHNQLSLEKADDSQQSFDLGDIVSEDDALTDEERAAGAGEDEDANVVEFPTAREVDLGEGAPSDEPNSDQGEEPDPDDEDDVRPTGEINVDELRGEAERSVEDLGDDSDLLPA